MVVDVTVVVMSALRAGTGTPLTSTVKLPASTTAFTEDRDAPDLNTISMTMLPARAIILIKSDSESPGISAIRFTFAVSAIAIKSAPSLDVYKMTCVACGTVVVVVAVVVELVLNSQSVKLPSCI